MSSDVPAPPPVNPAQRQSPWVQARGIGTHPFIFRKMIVETDPAARPGDFVHVYDRDGCYAGRALYNPNSQIVLRMLADAHEPVDEGFWHRRLRTALELRRRLRLDEATDAYRLVHAEGDRLSGLVVERLADVLVFEMFSLGMLRRYRELASTLSALLGTPRCHDPAHRKACRWRCILRADRHIARLEGFEVPPPQPDDPRTAIVREHGVRYRVDFARGQKTGFFCDQRDNRRDFAALCRDATVLDVCCYSGGFGLCAKLLGGAREVISVDLDEDALRLARENANLNQVRIRHVLSDAFVYLRQLIANGRQFDAVVLDPPKFATHRRELDGALRKYHDLNTLGMKVVRPGGLLLTCSCSGLVSPRRFVDTLFTAGRQAGRRLQMLRQSGAGPDHPVMLECPESAYLKAVWLRVW